MALPTLNKQLQASGISRRTFLKFCATTASLLALPQKRCCRFGDCPWQCEKTLCDLVALSRVHRVYRSNIALSCSHIGKPYFRSYFVGLSAYDNGCPGEQAEDARRAAMNAHKGQYLLLVDGSVPVGNPGYSTISGMSNVDMLRESAKDAAGIIAIGTCASFGGIPKANPNPTGAVAVSDIITDKPIVNISGCPPLPIAITAVLVHYLTFKRFPDLDELQRPLAFLVKASMTDVIDAHFFEQRKFAKSFDDEGSKKWVVFVRTWL